MPLCLQYQMHEGMIANHLPVRTMNTLFLRRRRNHKLTLWIGLILIIMLGVYDSGTKVFSQSSSDAAKRYASYFTSYDSPGFSSEKSPDLPAASSVVVSHALSLPPIGPSGTGNAEAIAQAMTTERFGAAEWPAMRNVWMRESGFNPNARNPHSGACGIPQALPCGKIPDMSTTGQIEWGLSYIKSRYGTPGNAWVFWQSHHWY